MSFLYNNPGLKDRRKELRKRQTNAEELLWQCLRNKQLNNLKFFRQYSVGSYILDFYCPQKRLAIELDGGHHAEPKNKAYDEIRSKHLKEMGIEVLRFWNNKVKEDLDGVVEKIKEKTKDV